ncbi:hypothetical protein BT69DRAFT_1307109 [Atractiella rhizophila]|nr:hypothetical protein BT69DRAFT_1307109 [Atractiella rhizophila]
MSSKNARRARLEELKAAREGGKRDYKTNEADVIYDELDDEDYRAVVKGRLEEEDFIEDDDGSGYVDNGMEFAWDGDGVDYGSDDQSDEKSKRTSSVSLWEPVKKKAKKVLPQPISAAAAAALEKNPYKNPNKKSSNSGQDEDFMASLLGGLDDAPSTSSSKRHPVTKRPPPRPLATSHSSISRKRKTEHASSSDAGFGDADPSSDFQIPSDAEEGKGPKRRKDHHAYGNGLGEGLDRRLEGMVGMEMDDPMDNDGDIAMLIDDLPNGSDSAVKDEEEEMLFKVSERKEKAKKRDRELVNVSSVKTTVKKISDMDITAMALDHIEDKKLNLKKPAKPKGRHWEEAVPSNDLAPSSEGEPIPETQSSEADEEFAQPDILKRKKKGKKAALVIPKAHEGLEIDALEKEGGEEKLRFYWLDYKEEKDGIVRLIGKVLDRNVDAEQDLKDGKPKGTWRSCCVEVRGIMRNLFVLPKQAATEKEGEEEPNLDEVEEEFESVLDRHDVKNYMMKGVKRKYAFEKKHIPKETTWLKTEPQLPLSLSGSTFSDVFGTNQSAFELLVLKRKIFGPCWLEFSWCKLEVVVDDPKDVNPVSENDETHTKETPPVTILSVNIRTVVNHKENRREIVCATARVYQNSDLDDPTPIEKQRSITQTWIRPLIKDFPEGFNKLAQSRQPRLVLTINERMLLNALLAFIFRYDPDVILSHDFCGDALYVLLGRMKDLKCDHWSRIGRIQYGKKVIPKLKQGGNLTLLAGRLICDLSSDGSKGHVTSTTWSLTELCETYLGVSREDIDPDDTPDYFDASKPPSKLLQFVKHCEADSYFQMAIASKVQLLPLTKQLTNLAGNSWNKTLNGGRAERNEYILLHEFHKEKYICPDKLSNKTLNGGRAERNEYILLHEFHKEKYICPDKLSRWEVRGIQPKPKKEKTRDETVEGEDKKEAVAVAKKDKYKGGLVFDPKRGLWDTFILVMDFNSLYPSIIQEFNIDFTTVDRSEVDDEDVDKLPDVPSSDISQGVLPRLIANLVRRRRKVKELMKDKSNKAKLLQEKWDIRQLALKLTANSMYGCLGFEGSRFYARPLAALTTSKGREILTNTRDLAESLHLEVIYGDTDSVMINTNVTSFKEAHKIGNEFKKKVNDSYTLLEIDIDAVFERMLLLQKKKYAAKKLNDAGEATIEVKGLDMKRREYCALSKSFSQFALDKILSGEPTEVVVEEIHEYLRTESARVRAGEIDLEEFVIFKRLGKNPSEYPDAKSLPHVQVAKRMLEKKQTARAGDVIPYVFCTIEDGTEKGKAGQAAKARHPDDVRRVDSELIVDYEYYLSNQVLPPLERLCDPIAGTDRTRIAECLGLDPNRFRLTTTTEEVEREFQTLESQITDAERFKDAAPLNLTCCYCRQSFDFTGFHNLSTNHTKASGITCPQEDCLQLLPVPSIMVQLDLQIRSHVNRLYEAWLVCDDASCGHRTRMVCVYPTRCLQKGCRGSMQAEYSDSALYNQILFYDRLFDFELARTKAEGSPKFDEIYALSEHNKESLIQIRSVVQKHFDRCGRRFVDMGALFSFMKIS